MSIKIDFEANAAYVYLPGYSRADTERPEWLCWTDELTPGINVDNYAGNTIGVEVIGLKTEIPIGRLVKEWDVPDQTIRELLSLADAQCSVGAGVHLFPQQEQQ